MDLGAVSPPIHALLDDTYSLFGIRNRNQQDLGERDGIGHAGRRERGMGRRGHCVCLRCLMPRTTTRSGASLSFVQ